MDRLFLAKLDKLREFCGFPLFINSGYRSPEHSIEKAKEKPGTHSLGIAADIKADTAVMRQTIYLNAYFLGFRGIGVYPNHVHIDMRSTRPVVWVKRPYPDKLPRHTPAE